MPIHYSTERSSSTTMLNNSTNCIVRSDVKLRYLRSALCLSSLFLSLAHIVLPIQSRTPYFHARALYFHAHCADFAIAALEPLRRLSRRPLWYRLYSDDPRLCACSDFITHASLHSPHPPRHIYNDVVVLELWQRRSCL